MRMGAYCVVHQEKIWLRDHKQIAELQRAVIQEAQLDFRALSQISLQHTQGSNGYHRVESLFVWLSSPALADGSLSRLRPTSGSDGH